MPRPHGSGVVERPALPADLVDTVRRASRAIARSRSFDAALGRAVEILREDLGWSIGHAWRPRREPRAELRSTGLWSQEPAEAGFTEFRKWTERGRFHPGEGLVGEAWSRREPVWATDLEQDPRFLRRGRCIPPLRSGLFAPVGDGHEAAALIELFDVRPRPSDATVTAVVEAVSDHLWTAWRRDRALATGPAGERHCLTALDRGGDVFFVVDEDGQGVFWSSAWAVVLGHADEDLDDFAPFGLFHPGDRVAVRKAYQGSRSADPTVTASRARVLDGEGGWREGVVHVFGLGPRREIGSAIVAWDESVDAEGEDAEVDFARAGTWCIDEDGVTLYVSRRTTEIFGVPARRLVGRPVSEVLDESERGHVERRIRRRRRDLREEYEFRFRRPDGEGVVTMVAARPVHGPRGVFRGSVATVTDITPLARARERLEQTERRHFRADRLESIGRLAAGLAHDFNNLLTAILGWVHEARHHLVPGHSVWKALREIEDVADRAARLTSQLLAYSRREPLEPRLVDPAETIRKTQWLIRRLAGRSVRVDLHLEDDTPEIRIDPGQFEQVITNLVVNAEDAMPDGGTLSIACRAARLERPLARARFEVPAGSYALVEVGDDGTGMDRKTVRQVFEPFFTTKEGRGTGLGLATVYSVVKQSDGYVLVDSEPDVGTRFRIYLPAAEAD